MSKYSVGDIVKYIGDYKKLTGYVSHSDNGTVCCEIWVDPWSKQFRGWYKKFETIPLGVIDEVVDGCYSIYRLNEYKQNMYINITKDIYVNECDIEKYKPPKQKKENINK